MKRAARAASLTKSWCGRAASVRAATWWAKGALRIVTAPRWSAALKRTGFQSDAALTCTHQRQMPIQVQAGTYVPRATPRLLSQWAFEISERHKAAIRVAAGCVLALDWEVVELVFLRCVHQFSEAWSSYEETVGPVAASRCVGCALGAGVSCSPSHSPCNHT